MDATKGDGQTSREGQPAKQYAIHSREFTAPARFTGTDNPRHLRVIHALLARPRLRGDVDGIAGCSNGPELVAELRRRGLEVPCERIDFIDRDGKPCRPGVYSLTTTDRRKVWAWKARAEQAKRGPHWPQV